ncbi:MAG: hypothetical protein NTV14_03805 [Coprothermobacterota bacterium]|nr:hypothetical protein [Coprothermobacterota bacterium]
MKQVKMLPIVFLIILLVAGCITAPVPPPLASVESVEAAIKGGALGSEFAERARKTGNLYVLELKDTGIPYPVFTFSDYQAGYSVLVENDLLVLLCAGFGGGYAENFAIRKEGDRQVLTYQFTVGSGMSYTRSGQYILGAGTATWQGWPDSPSP